MTKVWTLVVALPEWGQQLDLTEYHQAISGASGEKGEAQRGELSAQLPTLQQYHHEAC